MFLEDLLEFMGGLRGYEWLYYFWPFFVIDFGRYVFLDGLILGHRFLGTGRRRRLRAQARKILYSERPLVSVLVPGKNEGRHIPALVDSLAHQSYRNIELVVVDDGSDDDRPPSAPGSSARGRSTSASETIPGRESVRCSPHGDLPQGLL